MNGATTLADIRGQKSAVETLSRAVQSRLVHHAYRFEGPPGVGKFTTAIAFAMALLCAESALGCGQCESCRRASTFSAQPPEVPLHPDVVIIGRGVYPPDRIGGKREAREISVEQIRRVVLGRVNYSPHEGQAQVFVVQEADELSISAANALLKTLEEPRPDTYFVLLSSRSDRLLDTIRSRSLPVRFGHLSDVLVHEILVAGGMDAAQAKLAAGVAGGSLTEARRFSDEDSRRAREEFVGGVLAAMKDPTLGAATKVAEGVDRDRRVLIEHLRGLCTAFLLRAREATKRGAAAAELESRRHALVVDAIDALERNGAAALTIATLISSLRLGRQRRPATPPPIVVTRR